MLTFDKKYFFLAAFLFIIEVLIALYVQDRIIRPYIGDYLVVILIYCGVRIFWKASAQKVGTGVLLYAYLIELLQYFDIVVRLRLQDNTIAKLVIGYQFEWIDMLAYTLGILTVIGLEKLSFRIAGEATPNLGLK